MTTYTVNSGQTRSGISLKSGGTMYVFRRGTEILSSNGIAKSTGANQGGCLLLSGQSTASETTIFSGDFAGVFHSGHRETAAATHPLRYCRVI
jgi:hypothetical protein